MRLVNKHAVVERQNKLEKPSQDVV